MNTTNTPTTRPYSGQDAPWLDRQWFDQRPNRQYRLRPTHKSELSHFSGCTHVLVQKITTFDRLRQPLSLLAVPTPMKAKLQSEAAIDPELDSVLGEIFAELRTKQALHLGRAVRRGLEKARAAAA
jgi:hypothetical protein